MRGFLVSPGPHLWRGQSISRIMYIVVLALMFPTIAGIYFFGYRALLVMAVSIAVAVLTEYGVKKLRKRPFVMDGSAILTGLLLALTLPPTIPLWMVATGSVFSIAIVKEAFGGLGHNIFNPALGGRAFMMVSFPAEMTSWVLPRGFVTDAVTTATPLAEGFVWQLDRLELYKAMLLGNIGGSIGETSALLILIGGLLLIALRIIDWRIPLAYIATVALFTFALGQDAIFHVLAGGLMLGAFFMATDYVTSPITHKGRIIFGIGAGLLTVVIRLFGGLPEGVAFSILMMNAVTPLIDRHIKVKPYGLKKEG
ncbi:RnfABCDGE type electron transport complex subunit D [Dehalococcoidia bacterium]|nr:RnfABCDGE type electron transport complex subunit D [Dehalococcoidia bacterium]